MVAPVVCSAKDKEDCGKSVLLWRHSLRRSSSRNDLVGIFFYCRIELDICQGVSAQPTYCHHYQGGPTHLIDNSSLRPPIGPSTLPQHIRDYASFLGLGWALVGLFWLQLFLLVYHNSTVSKSIGPVRMRVFHNPIFWNLTLIPLLLVYPWRRLRRWEFTVHPLS